MKWKLISCKQFTQFNIYEIRWKKIFDIICIRVLNQRCSTHKSQTQSQRHEETFVYLFFPSFSEKEAAVHNASAINVMTSFVQFYNMFDIPYFFFAKIHKIFLIPLRVDFDFIELKDHTKYFPIHERNEMASDEFFISKTHMDFPLRCLLFFPQRKTFASARKRFPIFHLCLNYFFKRCRLQPPSSMCIRVDKSRKSRYAPQILSFRER